MAALYIKHVSGISAIVRREQLVLKEFRWDPKGQDRQIQIKTHKATSKGSA